MKLNFFRKLFLFLGDMVILYLCLIITLIIRFGQNLNEGIFYQHLIPFSFLYVFWFIIFIFFGLYDLRSLKQNIYLITRTTLSISFVAIFSVLFFYIFPSITPKTNLLIYAVLIWIFMILQRKFLVSIFSSYFKNKISIIGHSEEEEELKKTIIEHPQLGFRLTDQNPDIIVTQNLNDYRILLDKAKIINIIQAYELILKRIPLNRLNQEWILQNLIRNDLYDRVKRVMDIIMGVIFFVISIPFMLFAMILIKLEDGGPLFYKEKRIGKNGKNIRVIKFRTMQENHSRLPWTEGIDDPRITKVGKLLRITHIDEFPQAINIIKGDLSFVGPRPESIETIKFLEHEIPYYHLRHFVKPGATGWAQLDSAYENAVGRVKTIEEKITYDFNKVEFDLYYIKNRSLILDLNILLKSLKLFFRK